MQEGMSLVKWNVVVRNSPHKLLFSTLSSNSVLCGTKIALMSTWQVKGELTKEAKSMMTR
jgi:hypothetical protein